LIALEKQTKGSDFPKSRLGSVKQFMRDIDSEKSAKDLLQDTSDSRKRKYLSAVSPRQPKINETPAGSDSEMESIATDSSSINPIDAQAKLLSLDKSICKQRSTNFWIMMP
jgi:hypothetical protein